MNPIYCTISRPNGHSCQKREYILLSKSHGFASIAPRYPTTFESGAGFEIELTSIASAWIITPGGEKMQVNINARKHVQDDGDVQDWRDEQRMHADLRRGG